VGKILIVKTTEEKASPWKRRGREAATRRAKPVSTM